MDKCDNCRGEWNPPPGKNVTACPFCGAPPPAPSAAATATAAAENAEELFQKGQCCEKGVGAERDQALSVYWYKKAAELGHADAQYMLGTCYRHGLGVGEDRALAVHWWRRAAEQGHLEAQNALSYCHFEVGGVEEDEGQGLYWLKKAAEQGDPGAQERLGDYYFESDPVEAFYWWSKMTGPRNANGIADVQYLLGRKYKLNAGDLAQAAYWYKRAAKQGHRGAKAALEKLAPPEGNAPPTQQGSTALPDAQKPESQYPPETPPGAAAAAPQTRPAGGFLIHPNILPDHPNFSEKVDAATLRRNSDILEKTLSEFKVPSKVTNTCVGPVVTRYEMGLAPGINVNKVVNIQDNISMEVGGLSVRILAPIPGKAAIGIELPNPARQHIPFKRILTSDAFRESVSAYDIPVVVGADITGEAYVTDIAKAPHLLLSGTTGSGKSVCINSFICSMLMTRPPEELRLIMIDPKVVELGGFDGIPHLLRPVVTEPDDAVRVLQWCVDEMERRYVLLSKSGAKKLCTFNKRVEDGELGRVLLASENKKLPFIVVVIDELSDLMMTAPKEVEGLIMRIAQKARAAGIHLIVATQRPSTDIITGKIKANLSSRIAFRTVQGVDSRTIIDCMGAEKLLGQGDMLFLRYGAPDIERYHGALITEEEVEMVVGAVKGRWGRSR